MDLKQFLTGLPEAAQNLEVIQVVPGMPDKVLEELLMKYSTKTEKSFVFYTTLTPKKILEDIAGKAGN